jgi:hypothetical protein
LSKIILKQNMCFTKLRINKVSLTRLFSLIFIALSLVLLTHQFSLAAPASTLLVTNTNDSGAGSFRQAILDANAIPGADVINFSISSGAQRITLTSLLPVISDAVTIDGTTQPGFAGSPIIEITPDGQVIGDGLKITAGNSVVRGLVLNRFRGHALFIETGGGNVVEGNYIGTEVNGNGVAANIQNGVFVLSSTNNRIGGLTLAARNVISGNFGNGVHIALASGNLVQGNYIGVNAAGTAALPNESGVVLFNNASNNTVGGSSASARNVISGNRTAGMRIENGSNGNEVQGNFIGTNAAGDAAILNTFDQVRVSDSNNTQIGGATSSPGKAPGNVVMGVFVIGGSGTLIQGNLIGTNAAGTVGLANSGFGVNIWGDTVLGGSTPGTGNVISNFRTAVLTANSGGGSILGNFIGTDITGTKAIPNVTGISIFSNVKDVKIGGTAASERNVISGNNRGISLDFNSAIVKGNFIGTDISGNTALPNSDGIVINAGSGNVIGGTEPGAPNIIAFSHGNGITINTQIDPSFASAKNTIRANSIHSNGGLGIDLGANAEPEINLGADGVTLNDLGDSDSGPNGLQNHPNVLSVTAGSPSVIQGTLNSLANSSFTLDFYDSAACDDSGHGEGATYIGSTTVNTDNNGDATFNASFPFVIPTGSVVTATTTDSTGNTSEFSLCYEVSKPGTVQFLATTYSSSEQAGSATITIARTGGTFNGGSVNYVATAGTATLGSDFNGSSGTLNFGPGETIQSFTIPIIDDLLDENSETINLALSNASGVSLGTRSTAVLTILDNDPQPTISISDVTVGEGDSGSKAALFTLSLSAPSGRAVTVRFNTEVGSAFAGSDYTAVFNLTTTFNPGEITKTVPVQILGDTVVEPTEFLFGTIRLPTNATIADANGIATIIDDDSLVLQSEPNTDHALTLDSVLFLRDPFAVLNTLNLSADQRTRIMLFATGIKLAQGEGAGSITAVAEDAQGGLHPMIVEFVGGVPSFDWLSQLVVALPDDVASLNSVKVSISLHGDVSNKAVVSLRAP